MNTVSKIVLAMVGGVLLGVSGMVIYGRLSKPADDMENVGELVEEMNVFTDTVYICNSGSARTYHRKEWCSGMSRCSSAIVPVSEAEISRSRRKCRKCY